MQNGKKSNRKLLPIERFKHFRGIYLNDTQQYFLCDFYEVVNPDSSISYRVLADNKLVKFTTEIYRKDDKYTVTNTTIPKELQLHLIQELESIFNQKNAGLEESTPQINPTMVERSTSFIKRIKNYLKSKL